VSDLCPSRPSQAAAPGILPGHKGGGRGIRTHGDVAATMVFKSMRGSCPSWLLPRHSASRPAVLPKIIPRISRAQVADCSHGALALIPTVCFQAGHIPSCHRPRECSALSLIAAACRWSLLLLSPLLSTRRRPSGSNPTRTLQGMARVRSGQAPAWPLVSDRRGLQRLRPSRAPPDTERAIPGPWTHHGFAPPRPPARSLRPGAISSGIGSDWRRYAG